VKIEDIEKVISILEEDYKRNSAPVVTLIAERTKEPFKVLVSALISTRTRDETTIKVVKKLFKRINSPADLVNISSDELEKLLYPVGFYRNKARHLKELGKDLVEKYGGKVPDNIDDLLKLKGVGRKVATLVMSDGYGKDYICVDTHVHRIVNRWCLVKTKTPEQTEKALAEILPKKYWRRINRLLVSFGQRICTPLRPKCEKCPIEKYCDKCI